MSLGFAILLGLVVLMLLLASGPDAPRAIRRFGRLPGDVRIERGSFRLYLPIVSMLLASLVLTLAAAALEPVLALFAGALSWIGRLPGDVVIRREGFTLILPFGTMLVLSVLATLILNLVRRRRRDDRDE